MNGNDQNICFQCGFCCDGTLFYNAGIKESESIAPGYDFEILTEGKSAFRQPCPYYQGNVCLIYDNRPFTVCDEFKCELLKRNKSGEVSYSEALALIHEVTVLKLKLEEQIMERHPGNSGKSTIEKINEFKKHFTSIMPEAEFKISFGLLLLDIYIFRRKTSLLFKENKK